MSLDLLDGPLEAWESRGAPIPPHLPHSHTRKPSRHGRHRHAAPAPAPVPHSVQGTPRGLSPSPTPAHSTPRGPQSVSRLGLQCAMTSRDELTREILLGCLDATPRRERAELGTLVRDGIVGDVLSEVYPCLVPAPLPEPTPNHPLSGVLGPDVTVVPAFGRPNVVILLPCVSHARALGEGDVQDVGLAGAVCVAVDAIASPADIRVFGEPATRVPFFVRCVCGSDPCERELPENWAVTGCDIDAPGLEYTSRLPTSTLLHSSRFGPDAEAHARLTYLPRTRTRGYEAGEVVETLAREEGVGEDMGASRLLRGAGHGMGTLAASLRRGSWGATQGPGQPLSRPSLTHTGQLSRSGAGDTWGSGSPSGSPQAAAVCVNESRAAMGTRLRMAFHVHRVWAPDEGELDTLRALFPHRAAQFCGVCEVYKGTGTVAQVARAVVPNTTYTHTAVGPSPQHSVIAARLARKPLPPRTLSFAGSAVVSSPRTLPSPTSSTSSLRSSAPSTPGRPGVAVTPAGAVGKRKQTGVGGPGPVVTDDWKGDMSLYPAHGPSRPLLPSEQTGDWCVDVTAVGACDVECDVGWAEYKAVDEKGEVVWLFTAQGRTRSPFLPSVTLPHTQALIPILRSLGDTEPLGTTLQTLAHALFPARTDPMWHYIAQLQNWDAIHTHLVAEAEALRHRVTLPAHAALATDVLP